MKHYFKIPVYLEVETSQVDRKKVTEFFNKEMLPCLLALFRDKFSDFQEISDWLEEDHKNTDPWKKMGIINLSILDLNQHLREIGKK